MKVCVVSSASRSDLLRTCASVCAMASRTLVVVDPWTFDFASPEPLAGDDVLLRLDPGGLAARVERHLFRPDLRTLHRTPLGPLQVTNDLAFHLRRAGVPMPLPWPVTHDDPDVLNRAVDALGGFPVLVSPHGGCAGTGVLVAWNDADLAGIVRHFDVDAGSALLFAMPPAGALWRVTVVDDAVVLACQGLWDGHPATVPELGAASAPHAVPQVVVAHAAQAARAVGLRAATVDVLVADDAPLVIDVGGALELCAVHHAPDVLARLLEALCASSP